MRRSEKRKSEKKEDAGARKGRQVALCFSNDLWLCKSKSRLAKAAGAEPAGQMRDENLHAVVARSKFGRKKAKNSARSEHFWKLRCQKNARRCGAKHVSKSKCTKHHTFGRLLEVQMSKKVHAVVARSKFGRKKAKNTARSAHFWKLRCGKNVRCDAKHISKSKCTKHHIYGPLLEVQMSKKCTPLWREAGFQVKM